MEQQIAQQQEVQQPEQQVYQGVAQPEQPEPAHQGGENGLLPLDYDDWWMYLPSEEDEDEGEGETQAETLLGRRRGREEEAEEEEESEDDDDDEEEEVIDINNMDVEDEEELLEREIAAGLRRPPKPIPIRFLRKILGNEDLHYDEDGDLATQGGVKFPF